MNAFNFLLPDAVASIPIAWMVGWAIGFILWLLRYFMLELPAAGRLRGGEYIKW